MTLDKPKNNESKIENKIKNNQDMFDDISSLAWKLWETQKKEWSYKLESKDIKFEKYIYPHNKIWYIFTYKEDDKEKTIEYAGTIEAWSKPRFEWIVTDDSMSMDINPELHEFLYESLSKIWVENAIIDMIKKTWIKNEVEILKKETK